MMRRFLGQSRDEDGQQPLLEENEGSLYPNQLSYAQQPPSYPGSYPSQYPTASAPPAIDVHYYENQYQPPSAPPSTPAPQQVSYPVITDQQQQVYLSQAYLQHQQTGFTEESQMDDLESVDGSEAGKRKKKFRKKPVRKKTASDRALAEDIQVHYNEILKKQDYQAWQDLLNEATSMDVDLNLQLDLVKDLMEREFVQILKDSNSEVIITEMIRLITKHGFMHLEINDPETVHRILSLPSLDLLRLILVRETPIFLRAPLPAIVTIAGMKEANSPEKSQEEQLKEVIDGNEDFEKTYQEINQEIHTLCHEKIYFTEQLLFEDIDPQQRKKELIPWFRNFFSNPVNSLESRFGIALLQAFRFSRSEASYLLCYLIAQQDEKIILPPSLISLIDVNTLYTGWNHTQDYKYTWDVGTQKQQVDDDSSSDDSSSYSYYSSDEETYNEENPKQEQEVPPKEPEFHLLPKKEHSEFWNQTLPWIFYFYSRMENRELEGIILEDPQLDINYVPPNRDHLAYYCLQLRHNPFFLRLLENENFWVSYDENKLLKLAFRQGNKPAIDAIIAHPNYLSPDEIRHVLRR